MTSLELYHGSTNNTITVLEPRIARNGVSPDEVEAPAVYASNDIDYAIFMAVIGNRRWGGWSPRKFGNKGFYIYEEFVDDHCSPYYEEPTGTVYFLDTETFRKKNRVEWCSESPVKVLGSIAVGIQDLPLCAISQERHPSHKRSN